MNNDRLIGLLLGAAVLMGAAADVSALTIGRIRGSALLGQPLQLSIPVQYAADEDVGPSCFTAEVWYGDSRQDLGRTAVTLQPASAGQGGLVRISVSAPVSEPVVHVNFVAGCKDKTTRRYAVLADAVTVPAEAPQVVPAVAVAASTSAMAPAPTARTGNATDTAAGAVAAPDAGRVAPVQPKAASKPAASTAGSKLSLTPAETKAAAASRKASSNANAALAAQAAQLESLDKRIAAVEDWKGQQTNPDGTARSDTRLKALEGDLKGLQALTTKNQQNLQLLTQAVDQVQAAQDSNGLLYVFGALLAVCIAALGFVVLKVRGTVQQAMPWWRAGAQAAGSSKAAPAVVQPAAPVKSPSPAAPMVAPAPVVPPPPRPVAPEAMDSMAVDLDIDVAAHVPAPSAPSAVVPPVAPPVAPERADRRDFQPSGTASLRAINTQEMLDVRQQAEFFMALGQHDDAIKALESSIHASSGSNPLVYLDLLRVLHTLSRKPEFDRYRREFNHIFTGKVSDYKSFHEEGHGLDAYDDICRQIAELWPTEDAIDYLEQCMVRTPEDGADDGFDLEAFRDLLMLHGMLRRMDSMADSGLQPFVTSRTARLLPAAPVSAAMPVSAMVDLALPALAETAAPPDTPASAAVPLVDAGNVPSELEAASRDLHPTPTATPAPAPAAAQGMDLELDLDLGSAPEKAGNLIDFDISVSDYETKDGAAKPS